MPRLVLPALIIITFLQIFLFSPFKEVFEYDPDEGINLMKASLVNKGYRLYTDIRSDQPPVFTVTLGLWMRLFEESPAAGRNLVLFFSLLLVFIFYRIIRLSTGDYVASLACLFLLFSNSFSRLSVSVMIGLPALTLAIISIYCLKLSQNNGRLFPLILSGIFLGISLHVKFFTALLVPLILLESMLFQKKKFPGKMPVWFLSWLGTYTLIALIFFSHAPGMFFKQLFASHLQSVSAPHADFSLMLGMLLKDLDLILLSFIAVFFTENAHKKRLFLPLSWLTVSLAILTDFRPVWYHHYLLISIPLTWLAAEGTYLVIKRLSEKGFGIIRENRIFCGLALTAFMSAILLSPSKYLSAVKSLKGGTSDQQKQLVKALKEGMTKNDWILTDEPIYAFYAGLSVPPETAVFSIKTKGNMDLTDMIRKYRPQKIMIARFEWDNSVLNEIRAGYSEVLSGKIDNKVFWLPAGGFNQRSAALILPKKLRSFIKTRFGFYPGRYRWIEEYSYPTRFRLFQSNESRMAVRRDL